MAILILQTPLKKQKAEFVLDNLLINIYCF